MSDLHEIELLPQGRPIKATDGVSLLEALMDSSIFLRSDCGGRGTCGKCKVDIISDNGEKKSVCSCNTKVTHKIRVEIPHTSLLSSQILDKAPASFPASFIQKAQKSATEESYGVAVDLGTTTIAVYLCERSAREVVASTAVKNPQSLYGDDVMSRIGAVLEKPENLQHLQKLVVKAIQWAVLALLGSYTPKRRNLSFMTVVGNPTMIQILLGENPESIGVSPYQPAFYEARVTDSDSLGFHLGNVPLHTLPQISGFIGGDILSAALATDLENQPDGTLLIDLGTNGELILKTGDGLFATSCATGPAFEGASLSCGIQAVAGAINKVKIEEVHDYPLYTTVNSKKGRQPLGICGTGVISTVAELWRKGIVNQSGAFVKDSAIIPLRKDPEGRLRYNLTNEVQRASSMPVFISQKDIRSVQLGKAALITGIDFLLKSAGCTKPNKIIVAGAFGSFIDKEDMMTIGMIPRMPPESIEIAGNSAGAGAAMLVCDADYYEKVFNMTAKMTTVNLAGDLSFQETFLKNLSFPEPAGCMIRN